MSSFPYEVHVGITKDHHFRHVELVLPRDNAFPADDFDPEDWKQLEGTANGAGLGLPPIRKEITIKRASEDDILGEHPANI